MKSTGKKKKEKISYGNVDLPADEFEPKNGKFRVTMFLDLDLLDEIRKRAEAEGVGYQTWINKNLRELVFGSSAQSIFERLEALEKQVFRKGA